MPTQTGLDRQAFLAGAKAIIPLALPAIPFGLVFGLVVSEASQVDTLAAWFSSLIIFAGASQLAAIDLLQNDAAIITVILTVGVINARHLMYSAALSDRFRSQPRWFKLFASYVMVDQVFALANTLGDDVGDQHRRSHYLGSAAFITPLWLGSTTVGFFAGNAIPASWELGFAVPLMFAGLLVMGTDNLPGVLAAVVGGTVAVFARDLPNGSGLLVGAVLGVLVGGLADWLQEQHRGTRPPEQEVTL